MSVQFGNWSFDGRPVDADYLTRVSTLLAPYAPDEKNQSTIDGVSMLHYAFWTTTETRRETQPYVLRSGLAITWDGRLDNRSVLIDDLGGRLSKESGDVEIAGRAYEQWGTDAFSRLLGDWALAIWDRDSSRLILAKDFAGTRHLYYSMQDDNVTWSTILDPLVLTAGRTFSLNEEYLAGWLSFFPASHLTPYAGVYSVPPSTFVVVSPKKQTIVKYWDFDPGRKIRYASDGEYEEHFRNVLTSAVCRRLRSSGPVLAELSGGMDSSSIVCVADLAIAKGLVTSPQLNTVSYYDDSEPNWNERPYFAKVEEKRGRLGCHIDSSSRKRLPPGSCGQHFAATPGVVQQVDDASTKLAELINSYGHRVILSGIGGDEATGGVPTPIPELQDLLASAQFRALAQKLKLWALNKRRPWFHLFFEAMRDFFPPAVTGVPKHRRPMAWLTTEFVKRNLATLQGYRTRVKIFHGTPSFQANMSALNVLRRQLSCTVLSASPPVEYRYPYLDRELLEFLYAIPRDQLVRPGQRRSLMRRALVGIVPDEILNRKRKAFVARSPLATMGSDWAALTDSGQQLITSLLGIVNADELGRVVDRARQGLEVPLVALSRTHALESWLRTLPNEWLSAGLKHNETRQLFRLRNESTSGLRNALNTPL
jgi:asparagine synthase (glutamine-hydrolysing)